MARRKSFLKGRTRVPKRASKRYFSKHAAKTHSVNMRAMPMRGGFRI